MQGEDRWVGWGEPGQLPVRQGASGAGWGQLSRVCAPATLPLSRADAGQVGGGEPFLQGRGSWVEALALNPASHWPGGSHTAQHCTTLHCTTTPQLQHSHVRTPRVSLSGFGPEGGHCSWGLLSAREQGVWGLHPTASVCWAPGDLATMEVVASERPLQLRVPSSLANS